MASRLAQAARSRSSPALRLLPGSLSLHSLAPIESAVGSYRETSHTGSSYKENSYTGTGVGTLLEYSGLGGESGSARFAGLGRSNHSSSRGATSGVISGGNCGADVASARRINTRAPLPVFTGEQWTTAHAFTNDEVAAFAHMTGDLNPIHLDAHAAEAAGFAECVVHGILAASLFPALIAKNHPGAIYVSQTLRFLAPVYVGEQVTATVEAISVVAHRHRFRVTFASKAFKEPRVTPAAAADAAAAGEEAAPRPVLALDGIAVAIIPALNRDPPNPMD
ncbi:hypothetical protein CLOM_g10038 [Closterium sp. NIES-68]|nr:hypothetical protein CLOM_g10038 [Closterium sp. NIES-68]GJP58754.1 hypothetical protein CLOP_g3364 [Closterium sp. NIES-67]